MELFNLEIWDEVIYVFLLVDYWDKAYQSVGSI